MAAGDNTDTLVEQLQIRMENPEGEKFTDTMCIKALDYAHVTVAQLLRPEYLAEFQVLHVSLTMSANAIPITDLTFVPFNYNEGIIMVKHEDTSDFFQRVHPGKLRRYENSILAGAITNKIYWVLAGDITTSGATASTDTIAVYYYRTPAELTTDVDPLLNSFYWNIMLNFAEAQLWTSDKDLQRRKVKLEEAYSQIEMLNAKYINPLGIGTSESRRQGNI